MLSIEDPENKSVQRKLKAANKAMYKSKQRHFKYVHKARKAKNQINQIIDAEGIDIEYMRTIDQLYPPFPSVVTSFKRLDPKEPEQVNTVKTGRE